ncbi:MAG: hypothetical protein SPiTSB_37110 [Shewanella algae]
MMDNLRIGSLMAVPYGNGKLALCQVVWISNVINNCMGFIVLSTSYDDSDVENNRALEIDLPVGKIVTIYASIDNVFNGNWRLVGFSNVNNLDEYITHNIGGNLYKGDVFVRVLDKSEINNYRKVLNSGNKAVDLILCRFDEIYNK